MGLTTFHIMFVTFRLNVGIFHGILSVPQNTLMDMNNVMLPFGITHCYNILLRESFFTQKTQVVSMHTEEYDIT